MGYGSGRIYFPIPGTKRVKYLEENVRAAGISLSASELKQIEKIFPKEAVAGMRYTEAAMKAVNR